MTTKKKAKAADEAVDQTDVEDAAAIDEETSGDGETDGEEASVVDVSQHAHHIRQALTMAGIEDRRGLSDEELVAAFSAATNHKALKDVFDPGQLSGISCPTDPGTTPIAPPSIDPTVKALYEAQGFNTSGL